MVCNWILRKSPEFMGITLAFSAKGAPFPKSHFEVVDTVDPVTWWESLPEASFPSGYIKFAVQLMGVPASSASIKRIFSSFGQIHSKLRNRLGLERATKLVFCYRILRGPKELEH